MNQLISISIDVTKIEKARLFKGAKGTYLDVLLIPTPDSDKGDYMCVQSVSKEEREAGVRGVILGNGKFIGPKRVAGGQGSAPRQDEPEDDIPF